MYESASGVVTSFSATTRSTSRPTQPELAVGDPLDERPAGIGPQDDDSVADRRSAWRASWTSDASRPDDVGDALMRDRRHDRAVPAERGQLVGLDRVGLRADHDARPIEQLRAVLAELVEQDRVPARTGETPSSWCEVDHDAHHAGPFDVTQELVPEAPTLARALDQARDVGDHEVGVVVELHDAEVRLERRERIVGDLRLRRRDHADERRLAGVREPDEGDVGHQTEFEPQPVLLAVFALFGEARGATLVRQELGVAAPAAPARRGQPPVAVVDEFGEQLAVYRSNTAVPIGTLISSD